MIRTQAELDTVLLSLEPTLRKEYGLKRFGYFGSFARNEQTDDSDVDFIFEDDASDDVFDLKCRLEEYFEDNFERKVDVVPQTWLREEYTSGVLEDARYVENGCVVGLFAPRIKRHRMKRHDIYLVEMLEAMKKIAASTKGFLYDEYIKNQEKVDSVTLNTLLLGEAAGKIPEHVRLKYQQIPWLSWKRRRNTLVHEYWKDNRPKVWRAVQNEIVPNIDEMQRIVDLEKQIDLSGN